MFEALHTAGGVLVYGIPSSGCPRTLCRREIDGLKALGVDVETNMVIGRVLSIDELLEQGLRRCSSAPARAAPVL